MDNDTKIVIPGQEIGTEEEFVGGKGTVTIDSKIYATVMGEVTDESRTLTVDNPKSKGKLSELQEGMKIVGRVEMIVDPIAIVSIRKVYDKDKYGRVPKSSENAILHASYIKRGYVKQVRDELSIGDIIRAKIIGKKKGEIQLSTEDEDLGVLKAFASKRPRFPLEKIGTSLINPFNEEKENRKISKDYRNIQC